MRLRRVSEHIWQVHLWRLTSVNTWLVAGEDGLTVVDKGFAFMARDVLRAAQRIGAGPVVRVLLTHGHPDHAGGVPFLARELGVPVLAHRRELPYLAGERRYPRVVAFMQPKYPGLVTPLPETAGGSLRRLGDLTPWEAAGHTPGHVVYFHERDRVLLAGDLFKVRAGKLQQLGHLYSVDKHEATRSERVLRELRPVRVETSHGGGVDDPPLGF